MNGIRGSHALLIETDEVEFLIGSDPQHFACPDAGCGPECPARIDYEKKVITLEEAARYRATHSRGGTALGVPPYLDNREGRRALARTWRGVPLERTFG